MAAPNTWCWDGRTYIEDDFEKENWEDDFHRRNVELLRKLKEKERKK